MPRQRHRQQAVYDPASWMALLDEARKALQDPAIKTRTDLAKKIGISPSLFTFWEKGTKRPKDPTIIGALAEVLGLPVPLLLVEAGIFSQKQVPYSNVDKALKKVLLDEWLEPERKYELIKRIRASEDRLSAELQEILDELGRRARDTEPDRA